ncbi:MAG: dihydrodipicolinate synthase family protein [Chloroflexi bacterium]|nr:dihydrodipicolinate synthase family protein [Chloroflexota bacterium]
MLPVFQTPFNDDAEESVDFATLRSEIEWLFKVGSHGVVLGMVSEVLRLGADERKRVVEVVCDAARGRGPVVVSAGAESTIVAIDYAQHAERAGAGALMVIPPVSVGVSEDELVRYYERILAAVSIPVIVQDASGYVGRPMSISLQAELFRRHGPRVMFKPEATPLGPRLSALRDAVGPDARIFEGSGGIALVDNHRRGIDGSIPGADLADFVLALWNALERGDTARIDAISTPLTAMNSLLHSLDAYVAVEKYLLVHRGVLHNTIVRGPTGFVLDAHTRTEVDRLYQLLERAVA